MNNPFRVRYWDEIGDTVPPGDALERCNRFHSHLLAVSVAVWLLSLGIGYILLLPYYVAVSLCILVSCYFLADFISQRFGYSERIQILYGATTVPNSDT